MEITTELSIEHHLIHLLEEWKADLFDLNFKDIDGWSDANRALASAQYAYIKFGLILEKIRNECAYKYCEDKLKTFPNNLPHHPDLHVRRKALLLDLDGGVHLSIMD
jgi:hypothetical protein